MEQNYLRKIAKLFASNRETVVQIDRETHFKYRKGLKKHKFEVEQPSRRLFLIFELFGTEIAHNKGTTKTTFQ